MICYMCIINCLAKWHFIFWMINWGACRKIFDMSPIHVWKVHFAGFQIIFVFTQWNSLAQQCFINTSTEKKTHFLENSLRKLIWNVVHTYYLDTDLERIYGLYHSSFPVYIYSHPMDSSCKMDHHSFHHGTDQLGLIPFHCISCCLHLLCIHL